MWWLEHSHGGPNGTCFASLFINSSRAVRCSSLAPETHLERCLEALGEWVGLWTRSCKTHTSMHGCKQEENTLRIPMFLMCMEVDASLWWDGRPVHILHLPKQTYIHTHSLLPLTLPALHTKTCQATSGWEKSWRGLESRWPRLIRK